MPETLSQQHKRIFFLRRAETEQLNGVFTDMGMDAQRDTVAEIGEVVVGAEGNKHFVSDPVNIEDQMRRRLEGQSACQEGDHASEW